MKVSIANLAACLVLSACTTTSVTGGQSTRDGIGADLRVFLDDTCLPAQSGSQSLGPFGFAGSTLGEIAIGTGEIVFQSFGRYLEEAGQPNFDASMAIASDLFYSGNPSDPGFGDLNRNIRCIHIVRGGFEPGPAVRDPSASYGHLGLTSEPAFYALIKLVPAPDRSAYFRGELQELKLNRFERTGANIGRDIVISLEFGSPAAARIVTIDDPDNPFVSGGGAFAISAISLPGVERGRIFGEAETNGLVTSWMATPPAGEQNGRFAFNLYVDLVEAKRGNAFLQDIGRLLQSDPVVASVGQDIQELVYDDSERRRDRVGSEFDQRTRERQLRRALEDDLRALEDLILDDFASEERLLSAIRRVEDTVDDILRQRRLNGWFSATPDDLINACDRAIQDAKRRMEDLRGETEDGPGPDF
ncbi:MAG: hypothetical protein AAGK23_12410 [Pseudomonadota bacterium]